MQVICVIKPNVNTAFPGVQWPEIEVGDILTVADSDKYKGRTWYIFVGIDEHFAYDAELFSPISGISNEEIEEEYQEQEAAILDRQFAMIQFKTYYSVTNSKHITVKNMNRIVATSTRLCTNVIMRGIDPKTYYEKWKIVKEEKGYIFREVTHGGGICGHHKTLRGLIARSGGSSDIKIVLLDENETA